jgi:uncharacterized membrane protein YdbT with pleckstrin-like domain
VPTLFDVAATSSGNSKKTRPMKNTKKRMGPFTSFAENPDGVRFETQEAKETIVLFLRQHIVVNVPWVCVSVLMLFVPTFLLPLFLHAVRVSLPIPATYIFVGTLFWYVATFGFILANFLGWFINIYIVTNERIVDIDFYYLLNKDFSQAELNKVQDISFITKGLLSTIFNYGEVVVQTASESPNLEFDKVVETIRSLIEKHKRGRPL